MYNITEKYSKNCTVKLKNCTVKLKKCTVKLKDRCWCGFSFKKSDVSASVRAEADTWMDGAKVLLGVEADNLVIFNIKKVF